MKKWALGLFILVLAIFFTVLPAPSAYAARTTVVISVSIGGGVVVGMTAWFIHIAFTQRIAQSPAKPGPVIQQMETSFKGLRSKDLGWPHAVQASWHDSLSPRNEAPRGIPLIRLLEVPW
jgi:hypothetical protein